VRHWNGAEGMVAVLLAHVLLPACHQSYTTLPLVYHQTSQEPSR
jgi:hypothetical protein